MPGSFQYDCSGNPFTVDANHRAGSAIVTTGSVGGHYKTLAPNNYNGEISPTGEYTRLNNRFNKPLGTGSPFV